MDLKTFISGSLTQIIEAVAECAKTAQKHGANINPGQQRYHFNQGLYFDKATGTVMTNVEFDVAVTVAAEQKTKGGIAVAVATIVLGSQGESKKQDEQLSRVKFTVPIVLPSSRPIQGKSVEV